MKFQTNIGMLDKGLRIGVGALLIALALFGVIGWWGWLGLIPLATAFVRFCPLYALFGINTCPLKRPDGE
jgi:conserved domain protein